MIGAAGGVEIDHYRVFHFPAFIAFLSNFFGYLVRRIRNLAGLTQSVGW